MEHFKSSYGTVVVEIQGERLNLQFTEDNLGCAEAEICMQEYLDSLEDKDNGKFGKNEIGRVEEWEEGLFVADIY